MAYGLFHATFIIYRTTPSRLAPSSTTGTLFNFFFLFFFFFFLITRILKQDDLAAAFSTTSLTRTELLEWTCRRKQLEFIRGNSEVFLFCLSILFAEKTSKMIDRYLGNREGAI